MGIVPPSSGNPWRSPGERRPLATARQNSQGDHEVTLRPGADVNDLVAALGDVPANSIFTEHFGDVTAVLVFRTFPGASVGVAPSGPTGHGPDPLMASIPAGPIDREPAGLPPGQDEEGLHRVLVGVPLGAHDERIIRWLAMWESSTVTTVASLIHRARLVGRLSETP